MYIGRSNCSRGNLCNVLHLLKRWRLLDLGALTVRDFKNSMIQFTADWLFDQRVRSEQFDAIEAEQQAHSRALLRDIVGNPYRPVVADSAWLTETVVALAHAAHDECQAGGALGNDTLGVLADALEEAGCASNDLLEHLRGSGPHYRGCHVIDLLLHKT